MKRKSDVKIKKTANFAGFHGFWTQMDGQTKQALIRAAIKEVLTEGLSKSGSLNANGDINFAYVMEAVYLKIQDHYPGGLQNKNIFYSNNLWIWKTGENLGGVIAEEYSIFKNTPAFINYLNSYRIEQNKVDIQIYAGEKEKEAADYNLQKAKELADAKAASIAAKNQQDLASGGSTAKVALIAGGVIFLIILGIFLYKKYA